MTEAIRIYCDERAAKAKAEGEATITVKYTQAIMENTGRTLEEVLMMIDCTMEEYNRCLELLKTID